MTTEAISLLNDQKISSAGGRKLSREINYDISEGDKTFIIKNDLINANILSLMVEFDGFDSDDSEFNGFTTILDSEDINKFIQVDTQFILSGDSIMSIDVANFGFTRIAIQLIKGLTTTEGTLKKITMVLKSTA